MNKKVIYTWSGAGYLVDLCKIDDEYIQERLNADDMECVLCYLIDTDQVVAYPVSIYTIDEIAELMENDDSLVYVDNTCSNIPEKAQCYFILTENMKVIDEKDINTSL